MRQLPVTEHLPHQHSKGPNVRLGGEVVLEHGLGRQPAQWDPRLPVVVVLAGQEHTGGREGGDSAGEFSRPSGYKSAVLGGAHRPVVDVLAEAERRHLDASLAVDEAVASGQVFVHKAVVGQVLHPMSHLGADGNLKDVDSGSKSSC